jgi:predicted transcriptional regulator
MSKLWRFFMNRKPLSQRQLQVMEILWNAKGGMTASAIVKSNEELQINTVQASLRSLVAKKYIKVGDIVYSGTVLSRSYIPVVSREEYFQMSYQQLSRLSSSSLILARLIDEEKDENLLNELEDMIQKRKEKLEKGE